ncbi:hypothetical protein J6590_056271 [Homalodisca vitripennis]|nr:hypothetical protein J6590_056271 [Homalodisca vitripennis]
MRRYDSWIVCDSVRFQTLHEEDGEMEIDSPPLQRRVINPYLYSCVRILRECLRNIPELSQHKGHLTKKGAI